MAGETMSASLPIIVDDIRGTSFKHLVHTGVMRQLVKPVGVGDNGDYYIEPVWDPTGVLATILTEGTDFTARQSYVNATVGFGSTEKGIYTYITDNVKEDARESVVDEHSRAHGIGHAKKLEQSLVAEFVNFTGGAITATGTYGLDLPHIAKGKVAMQGTEYDMGTDLYFVDHPFAWQYFVDNMTNNANYGPRGDLGNSVQERYWQATLLADVRVFYSNYIPLIGTSTDRRYAGMFVKDTVGIFMPRDYRLESQRFITERATKLVSTMRYGSKSRLPGYGIKFTTLADSPV